MSDLISRQAVIDVIEDFPHGDVWNVESMEEMTDRIKQLPSAHPEIKQQAINSSDCVDRRAAIDAVYKNDHRTTIKQRLDALPSAQPERTPMQELLDVTADRDYWKAQCHSYEMTINRLTESIQPEIVRCKDCKYAEYIDDVQTLWCTECGQGRTVAPYDFCSYGERREDG